MVTVNGTEDYREGTERGEGERGGRGRGRERERGQSGASVYK